MPTAPAVPYTKSMHGGNGGDFWFQFWPIAEESALNKAMDANTNLTIIEGDPYPYDLTVLVTVPIGKPNFGSPVSGVPVTVVPRKTWYGGAQMKPDFGGTKTPTIRLLPGPVVTDSKGMATIRFTVDNPGYCNMNLMVGDFGAYIPLIVKPKPKDATTTTAVKH